MTRLTLKPTNNYVRPFRFNNLLDDFLDDSFFSNDHLNNFTPSVDIAETDKSFEFSIALPGVKKSNLSIEMKNGSITISGERKWENKTNEKNYHSLET